MMKEVVQGLPMSTDYNLKFSLLKIKKSNSLLCCTQPFDFWYWFEESRGSTKKGPPHLLSISIWLLQSAVLLTSGVTVAVESQWGAAKKFPLDIWLGILERSCPRDPASQQEVTLSWPSANHWYLVPKSQLICGWNPLVSRRSPHARIQPTLWHHNLSIHQCWSWGLPDCLDLPKSPSSEGCSHYTPQCLELLGSWSISDLLYFPRLHTIGFVVSLRSSGSLDRNSFPDQLSSFSVIHFNTHSSAFHDYWQYPQTLKASWLIIASHLQASVPQLQLHHIKRL